MRRIAIFALLTAAVAVVTPITATAGESPSSPPTVKVLDAGAEPREEVRIAPTANRTQRVAMNLSTTIEQSGAANATVGPIDYRILADVTPGAITAEQTFPISFEYSEMKVLESSKIDPEALDQIQSNFDELAALTGEYTMTDTGAIVDGALDVPDDLDPAISQLLEQFEQQASQLAVPLPEEPIGVGARWRVTTRLELVGIRVTQTYTYTLRDRSGSRLKVDVKFTQKAKRQRAELPGVPPEVDVTVTKYKVTGKGSSTIDLSLSVPVQSSLRASGVQDFRASDGETTEEISQAITLRVTTKPG